MRFAHPTEYPTADFGPRDTPCSPLAKVIAAQGEPDFASHLLGLLGEHRIAVDHCSIFTYDGTLTPVHLATASRCMVEAAIEASEHYAGAMYAFDPIREGLRVAEPSMTTQFIRVDPGRLSDRRYLEQCFLALGTIDKVTIAANRPDGWTTLNLYRRDSTGRFTSTEMERLVTMSAMLVALTLKHADLMRPRRERKIRLEDLRRRIEALGAQLSPRESEVCALALLGHTSESIALRLGVGHSTVLTFRRRAYAKLSVCSTVEIFQRVMAADPRMT